jgi:hypothetical protein
MIEYILCYAQSFIFGAFFGGAVVWGLFVYYNKKVLDKNEG